jgi:hypothetical protein
MWLGCVESTVRARADSLKATLGPYERFIPRVHWDACDVLAYNGTPEKVEIQENEHGRTMSWWYYDYDQYGVSEAHLLTLEQRIPPLPKADSIRGGYPMNAGSRWIVVYVGW